jgi:hypothetical protein
VHARPNKNLRNAAIWLGLGCSVGRPFSPLTSAARWARPSLPHLAAGPPVRNPCQLDVLSRWRSAFQPQPTPPLPLLNSARHESGFFLGRSTDVSRLGVPALAGGRWQASVAL